MPPIEDKKKKRERVGGRVGEPKKDVASASPVEAPALPTNGPLPRPSSLVDAAQTLFKERIAVKGLSTLTFDATEFTSVCPRTGQPDFGRVAITIEPNTHSLESKALKFYLWAFREEGMFCEALASRIADDVMFATDAFYVRVVVTQNPRGAIGLEVTAERGLPRSAKALARQARYLADAQSEA